MNFAEILEIKCIISLKPVDNIGTPLKVTFELIHPGKQLALISRKLSLLFVIIYSLYYTSRKNDRPS